MSVLEWTAMVTVGRVVRPHGRRGEVVVASETDFADERFREGETLYWAPSDQLGPARVKSSRPHDGRWVVAFEGIGSIDEAERLRGLELRIPPEAVRPLGPGAYYTHDLIGCLVETAAGGRVGVVTGVRFGSGAPLLSIDDGEGEVLVPLADRICRTVDVGGRRIVIDPPPGLLELNRRAGDARGALKADDAG